MTPTSFLTRTPSDSDSKDDNIAAPAAAKHRPHQQASTVVSQAEPPTSLHSIHVFRGRTYLRFPAWRRWRG